MSSDGKVHLTREEQIFLMEMLEIDDAERALEEFALLMRSENADLGKIEDYIRKIVKKLKT